MEFEEAADCGNLPCGTVVLKAKEYDPRMHLPIAVYLLPEVLIVRNQDSAFRDRSADHSIIINTASVFVYREDIMPLVSEPARNSRSGTLVHEEAHLGRLR